MSGTADPPVTLARLAPRGDGIARFAATCGCGEVTILYVPAAHAIGATAGAYQCGCGLQHRFAISITLNGGTR